MQDPQQSLLSRLATQSFSPALYFEITIGKSLEVSSRMKREDSIEIPRRSLATILSNAGFEFHKDIIEDTTHYSNRQRSTRAAQSTDASPQRRVQKADYAIGFDYPSVNFNDYVTVDGRTAAVDEPLLHSSNNHHTYSQGQKLKHNPLRYGGTFYGESGTTRSPFRYTSKYSTIEQSTSTTTEQLPTAHSAESLFAQKNADNYAYLYTKNGTKPATSIYQLYQSSHNEKQIKHNKDDYVTTNVPESASAIKVSQKLIKTSTKYNVKNSLKAQQPNLLNDSIPLNETILPTIEGIHESKVSTTEAFTNQHFSSITNPTIDFNMSLNFKSTSCPKKDVMKLSCGDLQCGIRAKATTNRAK